MGFRFFTAAGMEQTTIVQPTFVTARPATPFDGQEVYYQSTTAGTGGGASNSMASVGAVWHLRYRAAASGSYKWEVVGASPIGMGVGAEEYVSVGTAVYTTISANSPKLTVPVAGDYFVTQVSMISADAATNVRVGIAVKVNAAAPVAASYNVSDFQVGNGEFLSLSGNGRETFAKDDALTQVYVQRSGATKNLYRNGASLFITPIRVG